MKTLSDRITGDCDGFIYTRYIKQFIKDLKEEVDTAQREFGTLEVVDKEEVQNIINKLAGRRLTDA